MALNAYIPKKKRTLTAEIEETKAIASSDHAKLTNRDLDDQHPMSAITGLTAALGGKMDAISEVEVLPEEKTTPFVSLNGKTYIWEG